MMVMDVRTREFCIAVEMVHSLNKASKLTEEESAAAGCHSMAGTSVFELFSALNLSNTTATEQRMAKEQLRNQIVVPESQLCGMWVGVACLVDVVPESLECHAVQTNQLTWLL